ncbi:hypothetical protein EV200_10271 [Pedobacter psychrotolerans]|uniref:Lipoprotein n=1 Tax=Pedobacter psychrotolerans TaxID=1843235 RepID=A0A4R2HHH4_9SPHI|nr:hypothetical protein [Pedobacter psychrotolerans]TCO28654.1 hypothetical protein EV200_10271 [Pedobacter psychrotolerans]GGE50707.1 hypothetical protein GCM10011413_16280 [Pedobacter psychrotolerans]
MRALKIILILLSFATSICHAQQNNTIQKYTLTGFINKKIPVELNISVSNQLILGNIRYLNTKLKKPIKIIGLIEDHNQYSLHEFEKDGNISGSIYATLKNNKLEGNWSATKADTSYATSLTVKDNPNLQPEIFSPLQPDQLTGEYAYQYGDKGYQGNISIKKLSGNTYTYDISSVTRDPGRNIADASGKAVLKNNQLVILVNKSCKFRIKFYNGFLMITQESPGQISDCEFGFNATLEGTYLKVK